MAEDKAIQHAGGPRRSDVRVSLSLSPELAQEVKSIADEEATPVSVLIRRWIVERLRQRQHEQR